MENERIFVGNGKRINDWKIGISLCVSQIPKEWITESKTNGKKYLSLNLCERKGGADRFGNTHSLEINTYRREDKEDVPF